MLLSIISTVARIACNVFGPGPMKECNHNKCPVYSQQNKNGWTKCWTLFSSQTVFIPHYPTSEGLVEYNILMRTCQTLNYITTANITQQFPIKHASLLPYLIQPHPLLENNNMMKPQRSMQPYEENWMFLTYGKNALHCLTNLPVLEAKLQSFKKPWICWMMLKLNWSA
jgi:hypothetical protein